jgi:hypothetical protein
MVPTEVTETSTLSIHTPGNYPKEENTQYSQHGESLKNQIYLFSERIFSELWNKKQPFPNILDVFV